MNGGEAVRNLEIEQNVTQGHKGEELGEGDETTMLGVTDQSLWIRSARRVSYASIVFTLVGGLIGIVLSFITDSVSLLGYGLESVVDVWTSVLVLWRFWSSDTEDGQKQTLFNKREQKASFLIANTFILIGLFVGIQAVVYLVRESHEADAEALLTISGVSVVVLSVLAAIKFRIAKELNSPSLYKDGLSSVAVALLSFGILLSTVIYDLDPEVWWLDDVMALLISVFLIVYGTVSVYKHRKERSLS